MKFCDSLFIYKILHLRDSFGSLGRYKIALDLGAAVLYLHTGSDQCVVHGDIKPNNIILDSYNTKLGDWARPARRPRLRPQNDGAPSGKVFLTGKEKNRRSARNVFIGFLGKLSDLPF